MLMKTVVRLLLLSIITVTVLSTNFLVLAKQDDVELTVIELKRGERGVTVYASSTDDSMTNPDYKLLRFHWYSTANYYINSLNDEGLAESGVTAAITTSAATWNSATKTSTVFSYVGDTTRTAGTRDGYNVVSFGSYSSGVIGVTYIWSIGKRIIETDTRLNNYFTWSLDEEAGTMDVQNIMTHEFGHWCGLADLYSSSDYWLTMYGYADYGETYKRTLATGDITGLNIVY